MAPRSVATSISLALCALLISCKREVPRLDPMQKMAYETKPSIVRVNAVATARLHLSTRSFDTVNEAFFHGGASSAPDSLDVESGAGGSGTGFIVHPSGTIVTAASVVEPARDSTELRHELARNGVISFLLHAFSPAAVHDLAKEGRLDECVEMLAEDSTLDSIRLTNDVELSNGRRLPYSIRKSGSGGTPLAVIQVAGSDLPSARLASAAPSLQQPVWIAGYPAIAEEVDALVGGWIAVDSDLEPTLNAGVITARTRTAGTAVSLESSAAIYRGNEGGPVVDGDGSVVAVATFERRGDERSKLLVPVEEVRRVLAAETITVNAEGKFDATYRHAIDSAEEGRWSQVKRDLANANGYFPDSPELIRLGTAADRALASLPWWRARPAAAAGALLAALALVSMIAFPIAHRMRRRAAPVSSAAAMRLAPAALGRLTILNGERAGERLGLGGAGIRIGREAAICDIVLENPRVSRVHAEIVVFEGKVMLVDNNSSNGTYVNDSKIDRRFLEDGDIIYFGGRNAVAVAYHA